MTTKLNHKNLERWRQKNDCKNCVHYHGCRLFLGLALTMLERNAPFRDVLVPSLDEKCSMYFTMRKDTSK